MKSGKDWLNEIVTVKLPRRQWLRLERILLVSVNLVKEAEDYAPVSLILRPILEDLEDIKDEIERANPQTRVRASKSPKKATRQLEGGGKNE